MKRFLIGSMIILVMIFLSGCSSQPIGKELPPSSGAMSTNNAEDILNEYEDSFSFLKAYILNNRDSEPMWERVRKAQHEMLHTIRKQDLTIYWINTQ